jgi:hypothetical protein
MSINHDNCEWSCGSTECTAQQRRAVMSEPTLKAAITERLLTIANNIGDSRYSRDTARLAINRIDELERKLQIWDDWYINRCDATCCGPELEEEEIDPTPYCAGCGAMTMKGCHCGEIADND